MLLTVFRNLLGWGVVVSPFIVLAKIGAKPAPKPPDRLRYWSLAAYSEEQMGECSTSRNTAKFSSS